MDEISTASNEQTVGIEQINQAVAQMDDVTRQNASLVEEAGAAAENMDQQARQLAELVATFQLGAAQADVNSPTELPVLGHGQQDPAPIRAMSFNPTQSDWLM